MRRIFIFSAVTVVSLLSFMGCDDENFFQNEENDKSAATDSIQTTDSFEFVDLGLSVNWATFNVGATKPEEFGEYYAWGETETKTIYSWETYKWCKGSDSTLTKYCSNSEFGYNGYIDENDVLDLEDDVAHVKWGGSWRMPTKAEQDELRNNCIWTWTTVNGVDGYLVTSNISGYTDRSIFLPAAGYRCDPTMTFDVPHSFYGSSSLYSDYPDCARFIDFASSLVRCDGGGGRNIGLSVRPVCPSEQWVSSMSISMVVDNKIMLVDGRSMLCVVVKSNDEVIKNPPLIWSSDNPSVAIVDEKGVVAAKSVGSAHITASIDSISAQCVVTVTDDESIIVPEYVDLGLSVKWASFNVGAITSEDFGAYYAWGETESKNRYGYSNYKWYDGNSYTKYITSSYEGEVDNKTILDLEDDIAHVKWGGSWRIPTKAEQDELISNCTWTWTTMNGVKGYLITSKILGYVDRSIFLPAAGYWSSINYLCVGDYGYYGSSSLFRLSHRCSMDICFNSSNVSTYYNERIFGRSIRPVCTSDEWYSSLSVSMVDKKTMLVDGSDVLVVVIEKNDEVLDNPPFTIKWSSDNPSVAVVDQNGTVTAKSAGTANITASIENLSVQCAITVIKEKTIKHEYVDLGLSVKWATFNVGATKPEEYGEYYAWGEKVTKTYYQWYTYKWHDGSYPDLTKYCNDSNCGKNGFTDNKTILDNKDDVAHVKWGGSWRMPTNEEQEELLYRCTWDTMTLNGVNGFLVTSKVSGYTDCSIFLPAAGCREDSDIFNDGIRGYYWSSTLDSDYPADAYAIFLSPGFESCSNHSREYGLSVRPVYP